MEEFFGRKAVNLDSTHRCPLMCPNCARQWVYNDRGRRVPGHDVSLENFKKICKFMGHINFEGQYSDPAHHARFIDLLQIAYENKVAVSVQHAANKKNNPKNVEWYKKAWQTHPYARWRFSIDGLPKDSHIYRINQDGEFLFEMMKLSKEYLIYKPQWQYIVFNYNEKDINTAIKMAKDIGVDFYVIHSGRWKGPEDPLMPSEEFRVRS